MSVGFCSSKTVDITVVETLNFSDSTAQYIDGLCGIINDKGLVSCGLQCVVVLLGVYSKSAGLPQLGVCNRPFAQSTGEKSVVSTFDMIV